MLRRHQTKLERLNFHHLFYFWVVAEEGSVTAASKRLNLAQPSVSSQVRKLEEELGGELFEKAGRGRVLSQLGREVHLHAERIFGEGQHLVDFLNGKASKKPTRLVVGVPNSMPKLLAYRLLRPAYQLDRSVELVCLASQYEDLLSDLALNRFDLVLASVPIAPHVKVRAFNHLLGDSGLALFGTKALADRYRAGFPHSLNEAPMLLPAAGTELRRTLDYWFQQLGIAPSCVGEFNDSGLLKEFGGAGQGLFAIPAVIQAEVCQQYGVEVIGEASELRESVYAITQQKRIVHPGVQAIVKAARDTFLVQTTGELS
ncbi:LysR family transcriptional regulator [Botrimarina hoheduenensis]|uniref:Transcriptional activator protein NhaR n=1 Tax=Botrimarina hoheduenensis TaxID=2528000 RepID=A0A5C5VZD8_9BACT|nr:LysR family transcriptional regulator [Botrimarina hoheduenensis]TWT42832.1 Transcriptional activator protein NhaR [Botrimarina hoheduenensis]